MTQIYDYLLVPMTEARLVNAAHALKILSSPARVVPVDATLFMPNSPRNAQNEFATVDRIKSSVFFDLDVVSKPSKFPHMLPSTLVFQKAVGNLGIHPTDTILIYDRSGIFSGPRAAWTFTLNGHKNVYLLDHYELFKKEFEVESGAVSGEPVPVKYKGISQEAFFKRYREQVIEFEELLDLVENKTLTEKYYHFDARSAGRFTGADPEPRPELSSGHVPGSFSLPFQRVLNAQGHFRPRDELISLFKNEFGLDLEAPLQKEGIIVSCGSGVTAVILRMAIKSIDENIPVRVYDGSWTEWAQRAPDCIEKS